MKRRLLVLTLIAAASGCNTGTSSPDSSAASAAPSSLGLRVQITRQTPPVGQRRLVTSEREFKASARFWVAQQFTGAYTNTRSEKLTKTVEVVAADAAGVTQAKVRYDERAVVTQTDTEPEQRDKLLEGNTYVLRWEKDRVSVTSPTGEPVPENEAKLVEADTFEVGKRDALASLLSGRSFVLGDTVSVPSEAMGDLFGEGSRTYSFRDTVLTLKSIDSPKGPAVFYIVSTLSARPTPEITMNADITGKLVIDPTTGTWSELVMNGPIVVQVQKSDARTKVDVKSDGEMRLRTTARTL